MKASQSGGGCPAHKTGRTVVQLCAHPLPATLKACSSGPAASPVNQEVCPPATLQGLLAKPQLKEMYALGREE